MTAPTFAGLIPAGLCRCGCGQTTTIAKRTNRRDGVRAGQPCRYRPGHNAARRHAPPDPGAPTDARRCTTCGYPLVVRGDTVAAGWRTHSGRGLCTICYRRAHHRGDIIDHERVSRRRDDVLDDWETLRSAGVGRVDAARRLGMTVAAFGQSLYRARAAGDPRAVLGHR